MPEIGRRYRLLAANETDLRKACDALFAQEEEAPVYFINERVDIRPVFDYWENFDSKCAGEFWTRGRVFGANGEVRWERRSGKLFACLLTEAEQEAEFLEPLDDDWQTEITQLILWGEKDKKRDVWWQTRISGEFAYPVQNPPADAYVQITAKYYKRNEMVQLTRFTGVEAITKGVNNGNGAR